MSERSSYEPGTPCWIDLGTPDQDAAGDGEELGRAEACAPRQHRPRVRGGGGGAETGAGGGGGATGASADGLRTSAFPLTLSPSGTISPASTSSCRLFEKISRHWGETDSGFRAYCS